MREPLTPKQAFLAVTSAGPTDLATAHVGVLLSGSFKRGVPEAKWSRLRDTQSDLRSSLTCIGYRKMNSETEMTSD
jgi:hypothetical protein